MNYQFTLLLIGCIALMAMEQNVAKSPHTYKSQTMNWDSLFSNQGLVKVSDFDSTIVIDLRYSSTNNFTGKDIYGSLEEAYLQPEAMDKLKAASAKLKEKNPTLRLLIYDAARPRRIQQILWDEVDLPDSEKPGYVADPAKGSIHNYGCAVDLTIVDAEGNELDMGTDYDDFSEVAHITNEEELVEKGVLNETQLKNRWLLREIMIAAGFRTIRKEWWHFDAFSRKKVMEDYSIVE